MAPDPTRNDGPTRRDYVKYGGAIVGGSLLAGCTGDDAPSETATEGAGTDGFATAGAANETDGSTGGTPTDGGSYSASMAPMGEVTFDAVPEAVYTGLPNTADMAIALGEGDAVNAVYHPEYHGTLLNRFYERLDGVTFEWEGLANSWNLGKEGFYELDSDVHLTDPAYASTLENLDAADVAEIRREIAPWFGNYYSDRHRTPPESWADGYQFYDLWEIYRNVAEVFRKRERAAALAAVRESMRSTIEANLPPAEERPSVALAFQGENDTFWIYRLNADGFLTAHTRPLAAHDAFADASFDGAQTKVDYEALLDADPDVLLVLFTLSPSYSIADVRGALEDDPVAGEVAAVANDRVYAQGARYQGPLMNLFQLEMTAKQLYPDTFGEWPGYADGEPYPEIPAGERLFDRRKVADVVNGEV